MSLVEEQRYLNYFQWPGRGDSQITSLREGRLPTITSLTYWSEGLRSLQEILGYQVSGLDHNFGRLDDALFEPGQFEICFFLAKTRRWLPSKSILLSVDWVQQISWTHKTVSIDFPAKLIQKAPAYTPGMIISKEYQDEFYRHFGYHGSWSVGLRNIETRELKEVPNRIVS